MASTLLELRKAAGYRSSGDFAEAHGIPASTYARYESNPDRIPIERAWQLADILGTSIDAIVGRETPRPADTRGPVQAEYDGLTPEARALADEMREFVLLKDGKIRAQHRKNENRRYEALCYQYEQQMLAERREDAAFGELVAYESVEEARRAFLGYLREQAERKRGKHPLKAQELIDNQTIEKIMAAYDRTHGEFEAFGMRMTWNSVDRRAVAEYGKGGDAMA